MDLLLDTHAALWFLAGDARLSAKAKQMIEAPDNIKYVSIASIWEAAIKISLGKLEFDGGSENFAAQLEKNGFELLPIRQEHLAYVEALPFHHRDPFDRLLIAAALSDGLAFITCDQNIAPYGVYRVW